MKAFLRNLKQSPRKVRLVADFVRGKSVDVAVKELSFLNKKSADPLLKLLKSAISNTKKDEKKLFVKEITVDKGITYKRHRPVWRGMAHPIRRKRSNVKVILGEKK